MITAVSEMEREVRALRANKKRISFTNGCFDLVHAGHVASLEYARSLADVLIVGINTDESVRRIKGEARPVVPLERRIDLLSALRCVDYVIPFDQDTAVTLVTKVRPDYYVKGGDYDVAATPEGLEAQRIGGKAVNGPLVPGISTTKMINGLKGQTK